MDFDIEVDDKTEPDYDIADNFAENLVDLYQRCDDCAERIECLGGIA